MVGSQQRMSASERRKAVIDAAVVVFAKYGLYGASTEEIAAAAGVSQPYLFRLFGTKKGLFLAAVKHVWDVMLEQFRAEMLNLEPSADPLARGLEIGKAFHTLPAHQSANRLLLQAFAAAEDPDVRAFAHDQVVTMNATVRALTGLSEEQAQRFIAQNWLTTIYAVLDLPPPARP